MDKRIINIVFLFFQMACCRYEDLTKYYSIQKQFIFREALSENSVEKAAQEFKRPYIVISLGENCYPAMHMRDYDLSEYSFPFDWIGSGAISVQMLLQNDFKDFLKKEHLDDKGEAFHGHTAVLENVYWTVHVHDFLSDRSVEEQAQEVQEKFNRRIARFYRALNSNKKIYLVRTHISKQEALSLTQTLNTKFPRMDYVLVVLGNTPEHKINWDLKNVRNFYLENWFTYPNHEEWGPIFKSLGLIKDISIHTLNYVSEGKK